MSPATPPSSGPQQGKAITIRPVQRADIPAVAALMADLPLWQRHGVEAAAAAARLERGLDDRATILVAVVGSPEKSTEQIAGFIWYVTRGAFQRSGYVMQFGVAREFQRQGVGRLLMDRAEKALFDDADEIFLLVSDFNIPAQDFYAARGYSRIGSVPNYVTAGVDEFIYYRRRSKG